MLDRIEHDDYIIGCFFRVNRFKRSARNVEALPAGGIDGEFRNIDAFCAIVFPGFEEKPAGCASYLEKVAIASVAPQDPDPAAVLPRQQRLTAGIVEVAIAYAALKIFSRVQPRRVEIGVRSRPKQFAVRTLYDMKAILEDEFPGRHMRVAGQQAQRAIVAIRPNAQDLSYNPSGSILDWPCYERVELDPAPSCTIEPSAAGGVI